MTERKPHILLIGATTSRVKEQLAERFVVHPLPAEDALDAFLAEHGAAIEGVSTNGHDGIAPAVMAALPNLKVISCYGVGYDGIDAVAAAERGIVVTHTPGVLSADVANTAIMLMLAVSRCLLRDDHYVRSGQWKHKGTAALTRSIEGKPVGIIGLGRIGTTIARKLQAFDCKVVYHSRTEKPDLPYRYYGDLVQMAREVDYLVVITQGGPETRHLVNRKVIEALGPDGTLINISRGSVVDEAELVAALDDGRLGYAGLDVFEHEPSVPDALCNMDNVVLTPHIASATVETRRAMGDLTVENLVRYFDEGKVTAPVPECAHLPAAQQRGAG
jgi:lactate dehydrogenase-like 2-hydroxyacid dehydrogenase